MGMVKINIIMRYKITKNKLEYKNNIPVRSYQNIDPPGDRDTYDKLQINDRYLGYKNIVYTPISMPLIDVDLEHVETLRNDLKMEWSTYGCEHGAGKVLLLMENNFLSPHANSSWFEWVDQEIPHIKEFIQQLPFKTIRQCSFVSPPNASNPHYDEPINMINILRKQSPSQYRIRWSKVTSPKNEVFYLTKDSGETKIYPELPTDTNTFVYDGSVYEHGADKGFQMRDRSQLVISGCLDIEEHHVLLDKSIEKYKEYYLTNKYFE